MADEAPVGDPRNGDSWEDIDPMRPGSSSGDPVPLITPKPGMPTVPTTVPVASDAPHRWGRIDTDGTVYLRTADGERAVSSWQAGTPEEGLAHFARKFDDLRAEVELLHARLAGGNGDPRQTAASARQLKASLDEAAVIGDVAALAARIDAVIAESEQAAAVAKQTKEAARAEMIARKQALLEEVEKIGEESTQWKASGDRLRAILEEWKTIRGIDRKTDDQLWKRFSKAREAFNRRRGTHFAELDKQRAAARERKIELVEEAERLADSVDWGSTAGRYKQLMAEWKAAGRAPKDSDEALWRRFRAAQDTFFGRLAAVRDERDAEFTENARKKEELLAEAEKIDPSTNLDVARSALNKVMQRWDEIGKVPRERIRELDGRLKAVEDRVRHAADAKWRRVDSEAEARAEQFRERVTQFETQAAKARAAGDERRAKKAEEQAAQWREWLAAAEQAVTR